MSNCQRQFLQRADPGDVFRASDYAAATAVSIRQARRELAQLEEFGLIAKEGKGRATVYVRTTEKPK